MQAALRRFGRDELARLFKAWDVDGNGSLSLSEFHKGVAKLAIGTSAVEVACGHLLAAGMNSVAMDRRVDAAVGYSRRSVAYEPAVVVMTPAYRRGMLAVTTLFFKLFLEEAVVMTGSGDYYSSARSGGGDYNS